MTEHTEPEPREPDEAPAADEAGEASWEPSSIVGELGAEMILEGLVDNGLTSSSTKIILDALARPERVDIFEHMLATSEHVLSIPDPETQAPHQLRALSGGEGAFWVIPFLVDSTSRLEESSNRGTEAFASRLRDFFSAGASEEVRVLLVFTESGNETQQSARDGGVDRDLVTLPELTERLLSRRGMASDDSMQRVAKVYLKARGLNHGFDGAIEEGWAKTLARLDAYLRETAGLAPARRGERLATLGCFMNDSSEEFAQGEDEIKLVPGKTNRTRFGTDRLATNAGNYAYLLKQFESPTKNEHDEFERIFGSEVAGELVQNGVEALPEVDISSLRKIETSEEKNAFDFSDIEVEGAHLHRLVASSDTQKRPILLIAASQEVEVRVGLRKRLDSEQEHPRFFWFEPGRKRPHTDSSRCKAGSDKLRVVVTLEPHDSFRVFELVLAKGPRSYKSLFDSLTIAIYPTERPVLAAEVGGELLKQHHAWARSGDVSAFRIYTDAAEEAVGEARLRRKDMHMDDSYAEDELESDELDDGYITDLRDGALPEHDLDVRVAWIEEGERQSAEVDADTVEEALYLGGGNKKERAKLLEDLQRGETYLGAVKTIDWNPDRVWLVTLPSRMTLKVRSDDEHGQETAAAALLQAPMRARIQRRVGPSSETIRVVDTFPDAFVERFAPFLQARRAVFEALSEITPTNTPSQTGAQEELTPNRLAAILLADLIPIGELIEGYLDAWIEAADQVCEEQAKYDHDTHGMLLSLDQLENVDVNGELQRLTILPTHPWLLSALLAFQRRIHEDIKRASGPDDFEIQRHELQQLYPHQVIEDWFHRTGQALHLKAEDGTPFHWEYLPEELHRQEATLDYVTRLVQHKLRRYMRMHPHLRTDRRTLRVGFINPGDARQLFDGLEQWFTEEARRDSTEGTDEWLERFPTIELHLYARHGAQEDMLGAAFDQFFHEHSESSADKSVARAMLSKIRYRKRIAEKDQLPLPHGEAEYLHVCFAIDLILAQDYEILDGEIREGWDGCFAQGLLATTLRRSVADGHLGQRRSVRGLWIGSTERARPRALHRLLALVRGAKHQRVDPNLGINWQVQLPSMEELHDLYRYSDWVVHLDRELSIEMFDQREQTIIEYSDQADPQSPGYDVITVTRHAGPYLSQLEGILDTVNLSNPRAARPPEHSDTQEWTAQLLGDLNALSGTWALDFLEGNIARGDSVNRLKGHLGCALVYRWLRRVEQPRLEEQVGELLTPIHLSLDEIIRATPVGGLTMRDGLASRSRREDRAPNEYCDDLLVLYLTRAEQDKRYRIYGRIIEVKFGKTALAARARAIRQVSNTHELLRRYFGGGSERLDAIFRQKQLSLIIKEQLEQASARGELDPAHLEQLNLPLLSARLATGDYVIEYDMLEGGELCRGDAFLLSTEGSKERPEGSEEGAAKVSDARIEAQDGVRVVTLERDLLEWLAFEPEDGPTLLHTPTSTFPHLGSAPEGLAELSEVSLTETSSPPEYAGAPPEPSAAPSQADPEQPPSSPPPPSPAPPQEAPPAKEQEAAEAATTSGAPEPPQTRAPDAAMTLEQACEVGLHDQERDFSAIQPVIDRLAEALRGHSIDLATPPDPNKVALGPRLMRVMVEARAGESIGKIRRISEDIARHVGTITPDVHIQNSPRHRAIAFDLPIEGFGYQVLFEDIVAHPSFQAVRRELRLPFCAGIEVTGRPRWVDLAGMPHMLLAGSTGSGKTVFLRNILLTMALQHTPEQLALRLSSSKEMDFRVFTRLPHVDEPMATNAAQALAMVRRLVEEMDRRVAVISDALCDHIDDYNADPLVEGQLPRIACIIDEYAETVLSFEDKADRRTFEELVARLAQKARAAGIHLILSMQRPDSSVIQGAIKSNIVHRFALRLPQNHDSRVILDESGAEALLGKGDMLYKDGAGMTHRLQVPNLLSKTMKRHLRALV